MANDAFDNARTDKEMSQRQRLRSAAREVLTAVDNGWLARYGYALGVMKTQYRSKFRYLLDELREAVEEVEK